MSSNVENTEAQQADEAGLTVFRYKLKPIRDDQWGAINIKRWGQAGIRLAVIKPKKTRPALVSRKPKEPQGLDSTHPTPASASDGLQARTDSG